jgi:hypothetical protein
LGYPFVTPALLHRLVIGPVLAELKWPKLSERESLLLAIAIQESSLMHRRQTPNGPARSFWQIEAETCVDCLARSGTVRKFWDGMGFANGVHYSVERALENSDIAACAVAAGILRLTPGKLPIMGDEEGAWSYYLKAWRPGRPRKERWRSSYAKAMGVFLALPSPASPPLKSAAKRLTRPSEKSI